MGAMPYYINVYDSDDTVHTITITNLKSSHSGKYNCYGISNGTGFKAIAHLYVGSESSTKNIPTNIKILNNCFVC